MAFTPLADRVLVKRVKEEDAKVNGLFRPDITKEKPQEGTVVAAGPGRYTPEGHLIPIDVIEGDRILFGKYSGTDIKLDDEELLILREDEILGRLTSDAVVEDSQGAL